MDAEVDDNSNPPTEKPLIHEQSGGDAAALDTKQARVDNGKCQEEKSDVAEMKEKDLAEELRNEALENIGEKEANLEDTNMVAELDDKVANREEEEENPQNTLAEDGGGETEMGNDELDESAELKNKEEANLEDDGTDETHVNADAAELRDSKEPEEVATGEEDHAQPHDALNVSNEELDALENMGDKEVANSESVVGNGGDDEVANLDETDVNLVANTIAHTTEEHKLSNAEGLENIGEKEEANLESVVGNCGDEMEANLDEERDVNFNTDTTADTTTEEDKLANGKGLENLGEKEDAVDTNLEAFGNGGDEEQGSDVKDVSVGDEEEGSDVKDVNVGDDTNMAVDTNEDDKLANTEGLENVGEKEDAADTNSEGFGDGGDEEEGGNERDVNVGEDTNMIADTSEDDKLADTEGLQNIGEKEDANLESVVGNGGEDTNMVAELDDTTENDKVSNREEHPQFNQSTDTEDVVNDMDMTDREGERDNEQESESPQVDEKMKEVEEESNTSVGGKRKRGKNAAIKKKGEEEDVCFICFDGGNLVLCDRRGCPKAYHPSCVNRDDAFFQTKGKWNCGWHLCSNCQKNAHYMCFTCTFSLCKGCIKEAVIFCVRGNKGFCETCMRTVTMIEKSEQGNIEVVDFNDKSSWEYLFKDYWIDLKGKLSLTSEELAQAKNPWKGINLHSGKQGLSEDLHDANSDGGSGSDSSSEDAELTASKRRKGSKRLRSRAKGRGSKRKSTLTDGNFEDGSVEWASKELIKFVSHMKNGDKSVCSQFDVQALLLEYIKRNKLRDPRKKSQIICDARLESLFGKPRVGHFEMLKLLESHFFLKEDSHGDDLQGSAVDNETNLLETDGSTSVKMNKDKKGKSRKKGRGLQSNLDDFAAIDMHNINLIYLRRSLLEKLLEDTETFYEKAVGSFVRIRISGNAQKQDLYRLVQVVGTSKAAEPYKVGKKMTEFMLEILNLSKTESVSIDIISNQGFTEDECKRLRQSIKCGLINSLTVGDIQEKALALQAVRIEDLLEAEVTRLSHLRDRASDMGKRKELRECVEKLQLLKTPEERQKRMKEIPEIHVDPNMDPNIESEEDEDEADDNKQESFLRPRGGGFSRRGKEPLSPRKGGFAANDSWSGTKNFSSSNRELSRSMSNKGFSNKADDAVKADEMMNDSLWSHGREKELQASQSWEKSKTTSNSEPRGTHSQLTSEMPRGMSEMSPTHPSVGAAQSALNINESDKIWHYRDPNGKVQGPFSNVQLKKWSNTGYFPGDLRIWRITEKEDDSILLADALKGNFQKETPPIANSSLQTRMPPEVHASPSLVGRAGESWKPQAEISNSAGQVASATVGVPNNSSSRWGPESNLPSPTPARTPIVATKGQLYESQWSPTPAQPADNGIGANPFSRGSRDMPHRETGHHNTQLQSQSEVPNDSLRRQVNSHLHTAPDSSGGTTNVSIDLKSLQNLIQPITGNKPLIGAQGWTPTTVSKLEMSPLNSTLGSTSSQKQESEKLGAQPNPYGNWVNAPASVPNSASFSTANPTGISPVPAPSSSMPRGPFSVPLPGHSSVPPSIPLNMQWGPGVADHKSISQRQGAENQVPGRGAIPSNLSSGWGGQASANPNQGWAAPGQASAPGNTNMGRGAPSHVQVHGNTNSGWVGHAASQTPGNAYQNWAPTPQGSAQMNPNAAWSQGQPPANPNASWGAHGSNEKNSKGAGDRFPSQQWGDSGYGGNKAWSRQSSFGNRGDSSRPPFKGQKICKFHESGHCKKGAQCDYLHT